MKDINHNSKIKDQDTTYGNTTAVTKPEPRKETKKDEKSLKNNDKKVARTASDKNLVDFIYSMYTESCKDNTNKVANEEHGISGEEVLDGPIAEKPVDNVEETPLAPVSPLFVPKCKGNVEQWSSQNKSDKRYDLELLKQIKENPLSNNKPNAPLLEACNVIRTEPVHKPTSFNLILRPVNDTLFPAFLKGFGGPQNNTLRDPKKGGRNVTVKGKGSAKLGEISGSNSSQKPIVHVSLPSREDVKLKQVESAWKPTRLQRENLSEEEIKTQELYKKFRGILNKLTPQKFETLLKKVLELEIDNQKRMEGVIDLLFEKAIEEPNFSEVYANMCLKLSKLKVPSDNNGDNRVTFSGLIITKCQTQFETGKSDERLMNLEKELAEIDEPVKKKELQIMIQEENRKIRLRAVANVRFIGELYKLKMLTCKIMKYCMRHLIDPLEEENLECLCKLLTTIGHQIESEDGSQLDSIFKRMQEIVKSNKISSRVKFMIQDVIDLRKRKWLVKNVVDSQPKMMEQIQKEAELQERHIELMNAGGGGVDSGAFRRDDSGRNKCIGDSRRPPLKCVTPRPTRPASTNFRVDQFKLQAGSNQKIMPTIKLAPPQWMIPKSRQPSVSRNISTNMFSVLENVPADPTSLKVDGITTPACSRSSSVKRSPSNTRGDCVDGPTGSLRVSPLPRANTPQEPLSEENSKKVKPIMGLSLINPDVEQFRQDILQFETKYHAALISLILNVLVEKAVKDVNTLSKSLVHLVTTNTISSNNFEAGLKDTLNMAPDQYIDIPKFYDNIGIILAPHIQEKHMALAKTFELSETVIAANQGHLLLKAILHNLKDRMGPTSVKDIWQESGQKLRQWMKEEQVPKWIADNKFEFLEDQASPISNQENEESIKLLTPSETQTNNQENEESTKILTLAEIQSRLLQMMNSDENCDDIKRWVQEKLGKAHNEDWFMRALTQAICEYALLENDCRDVTFYRDRLSKYAEIVHEFGDSKESREANCKEGIQRLVHRIELPQGLTPDIIFQYLHEQSSSSFDA